MWVSASPSSPHHPPSASAQLPGTSETAGPRGPAGRGTFSLGKGGGAVESHCRGWSAQNKTKKKSKPKCFPKADFYQGCPGRAQDVKFQLRGLCFYSSDPRSARWSQVSECHMDLRSRDGHLDVTRTRCILTRQGGGISSSNKAARASLEFEAILCCKRILLNWDL